MGELTLPMKHINASLGPFTYITLLPFMHNVSDSSLGDSIPCYFKEFCTYSLKGNSKLSFVLAWRHSYEGRLLNFDEYVLNVLYT